jgi:arachidonate 15-lipoxygenase
MNRGFDTPTEDNLRELFEEFLLHTRRVVGLERPGADRPASAGPYRLERPGMPRPACVGLYASDEGLLNDKDVLAWAERLNMLFGARIVDLEQGGRERLAQVLAQFIFLVTAQHEMVGSLMWNYQLWTHRQPVRVYRDGRREPLDVYQRLVNYNYTLNTTRTPLIPDGGHYGYLADGLPDSQMRVVGGAFRDFTAGLVAVEAKMRRERLWQPWLLYPSDLEAHINA